MSRFTRDVKGALEDRYGATGRVPEHNSAKTASAEREREKSGTGGDKQSAMIKAARGRSASDYKSQKPGR
jgi:hypothetical protein